MPEVEDQVTFGFYNNFAFDLDTVIITQHGLKVKIVDHTFYWDTDPGDYTPQYRLKILDKSMETIVTWMSVGEEYEEDAWLLEQMIDEGTARITHNLEIQI